MAVRGRHDLVPGTRLARDRADRPRLECDSCPGCGARMDCYAPPDCQDPGNHKRRPKGEEPRA